MKVTKNYFNLLLELLKCKSIKDIDAVSLITSIFRSEPELDLDQIGSKAKAYITTEDVIKCPHTFALVIYF